MNTLGAVPCVRYRIHEAIDDPHRFYGGQFARTGNHCEPRHHLVRIRKTRADDQIGTRIGNSCKSHHLKLPEGQISEVRAGQVVTVDSQQAPSAKGRVTRVDRAVNGMATVIVGLLQDTSAAPGTTVDGTIELERLNDTVYVGRPFFAQPNSEGTLFKVDADGLHATKVRVRFGRPSVNTLQVLEGLQVGDRVILSDMRPYEKYDRVALK